MIKNFRQIGELADIANSYDGKYSHPNYFKYKSWLYRPFVKALAHKAKLTRGGLLLDAGCGQGFFTSLFAGCGLNARGVDISAEGIKQARRDHGSSGAEFEVGNICALPYENMFDCVYSRSCSLYTSDDFAENRTFTDILMKYVKPGGVFIFDYYSNLCPRKQSSAWLYHSVDSVRRHFAPYSGSTVFFSLRLDAGLFGSSAFRLSKLNQITSRIMGIGGDLVAIVPKKK